MESPTPFVFQYTADGTPTLSVGETGEWMHHRQSALSETLYVYGAAVEKTLDAGGDSFLVVGLGLGYIEMLLAARSLAHPHPVFVDSYEASPELRDRFSLWLEGKAPPDYEKAYNRILAGTARHFDLDPGALRERLIHWRSLGFWKIHGALDENTHVVRRYSAILFDAFSHDTSPELWHESALDRLLTHAAGSKCAFATYASTVLLKRVLRRHSFPIAPRHGFAGKRECTLAQRA